MVGGSRDAISVLPVAPELLLPLHPPVMKFSLSVVIRATFASILLIAPLTAGDIKWEAAYEETLASAAAEARVVFIAVNMTGERANERMIADVYPEKKIEELAALTLNMVATNCWQDKRHAISKTADPSISNNRSFCYCDGSNNR